ncbi:hypothetical protein CBR_g19461 [Chara braunii]|uniref:Uncharacterized protein n=1 Tax=Chara braunii TaxID=69332 RepID=A0A388KY19_CHABU|nr:hypothetical protein CBR_g19461 [Chara braunii]|eukprot:GBG74947.1 hypothetical protein CBR_g19461 [Chara braunii]
MASPARARGGSGWGFIGERYNPAPNRELAIEKGKKNMLYKYPRGRDNMITFDLRQQFALSAHPQDIGTESVGLGLYFTSVLLLISFFVILSLFSLYPLFSNWHADHFAPYAAEPEIQMEQKNWWLRAQRDVNRTPIVMKYPTYSALTRLSLGSFCGEPRLASWFYCRMACGKFNQSICDNARMIENSHKTPPEAKGLLISKPVDSLQLWDVTMMNFLFMAFLLFLKYIQNVSSERMNASATTASDYTVYVEGLPREPWVKTDDVAKFFAHYGTVVSVAISYNFGKHLALDRQLWRIRNSLAEARALVRGVQCNGKEFGHWLIRPIIGFIYWTLNNGGLARGHRAVLKLEKDYADAKQEYAKLKVGCMYCQI